MPYYKNKSLIRLVSHLQDSCQKLSMGPSVALTRTLEFCWVVRMATRIGPTVQSLIQGYNKTISGQYTELL